MDPWPGRHIPATEGARPVAVSAEPSSRRSPRSRPGAAAPGNGTVEVGKADLEALLGALRAAAEGDFEARLRNAGKDGIVGELAQAFNHLADKRQALTTELVRLGKVIGREGRMTERASLQGAQGGDARTIDAVNTMVEDLVRPTQEVARVIDAVAEGDLTQKMQLKIEGRAVRGEFLRI